MVQSLYQPCWYGIPVVPPTLRCPPGGLPPYRDFGGRLRFSGPVATIKCFENNPLVRAALEEQGGGRVLVVDGGASKRCALLGDNIAAMAVKNGWSVSHLSCFNSTHPL